MQSGQGLHQPEQCPGAGGPAGKGKSCPKAEEAESGPQEGRARERGPPWPVTCDLLLDLALHRPQSSHLYNEGADLEGGSPFQRRPPSESLASPASCSPGCGWPHAVMEKKVPLAGPVGLLAPHPAKSLPSSPPERARQTPGRGPPRLAPLAGHRAAAEFLPAWGAPGRWPSTSSGPPWRQLHPGSLL